MKDTLAMRLADLFPLSKEHSRCTVLAMCSKVLKEGSYRDFKNMEGGGDDFPLSNEHLNGGELGKFSMKVQVTRDVFLTFSHVRGVFSVALNLC